MFTEKTNKIALSNNNDKRSQILIELNQIYMVQMLKKYAKQNH